MTALVTFGLGFVCGAIFAVWYARLRRRMYAELEQGLGQIRQRLDAEREAEQLAKARRMDHKLKSFFRSASQVAPGETVVQVEAGSDMEAYDVLVNRRD